MTNKSINIISILNRTSYIVHRTFFPNRTSYLVLRTFCLVLLVFLVLLQSSCYSFKEGRIDPLIQTVSIYNFTNQSSNGNAQLNQGMTDALRNRFITQTNLRLVPAAGDIEFSGVITGYNIQGTAPIANQTTALSRLTLTVKVDFVNNTKPGDQWSQSFSRFADYSSSQSLLDVEAQLLQDIYFQLVEDIYNKALVNW